MEKRKKGPDRWIMEIKERLFTPVKVEVLRWKNTELLLVRNAKYKKSQKQT